ncbi:MAG: SelB C-terminal domain-containing protein [Acidobacteriota bacterium]
MPDLETMTEGGTLLEIPQNQGQDRRWIARSTLDGVKVRAQEILEAYFARDPMALGVPKGEAVERVLPRVPKHLARTYFDWLEGAGVLTYAGELVTLPGRKVQLGEDAQRLIEEIGTLYEDAGFEPPTEDELAEHLGDRRKGFRIALRYLTDTGRLRRLPNGATVAQSILDGLYRDVRGEGWERFTVPQFKERFGLSRKWAIPLLEHLDSIGVTRRVGNERVLFG